MSRKEAELAQPVQHDIGENLPKKELQPPKEFFGQVFAELDAIPWENEAQGRSLEQVSEDALALCGRIDIYYKSLTPVDFLKHADFWLDRTPSGLAPDIEHEAEWLAVLKIPIEIIQENGGVSRFAKALSEQDNPDVFSFYQIHRSMRASDLPYSMIKDRFIRERPDIAEKYGLEVNDRVGGNIDISTNFPLYKRLRLIWEKKFADLDTGEQQAKYIHFIGNVENIFLQEPLSVEIMSEELLREWQECEFEGKAEIDNPGCRLDKISRGLAEMGLASLGVKSAWRYVGTELPQEFMEYLFRYDRRENPVRLFDDMLQLADKGQFLYPPQLYYLFRHVLPKYQQRLNPLQNSS